LQATTPPELVVPPVTPAQPVPPPPEAHAVQFTANGAEYFRIWIVNLALTVVTLGIYSPWAKVRRKRYFHEHTAIDGEPFEYRGKPIAILKGRLVAVSVAAVFYAITHFAPSYFWVPLVVLVFLGPFLLVRSFAFNAYNSAWRNIRFHFHGRYWPAWRLLVGYGFLTLITLGLGYAFLKTRLTEFTVRNHSFGATRFEVPNLKKPFFNAYAKVIGLVLLMSVAVGLLSIPAVMVAHGDRNSPIVWAINAATYVLYLGIFAYIRSRILNHTWNNVQLGSLRFRSTLKAMPLWGLYLTNVLGILATLGIFTPWAVVRTLRYRAEHLEVLATEGSLESFAAAQAAHVSAVGEEVGEMLDMDFSI
jgi:uncharacterized membrane protein YjgN (DUF898 family)